MQLPSPADLAELTADPAIAAFLTGGEQRMANSEWSIEALRVEIEIGIRELDAGLGEELDIEDVIRRARAERAGHDCL